MVFLMFSRLLYSLSLCVVLPGPLLSHEFWIDPEEYQVESGQTLRANFRNGQEFEGNALAYFDRRSTRFDLIAGGETRALSPRPGDRPALDITAPDQDGLVTLVHETTPQFVTYTDWAKFEAFIDHKDFTQARAVHSEKGWSKEKFRERYTRHVKALIAVGDGAGTDRAAGLKTEFVALTNPYAEGFDGPMQVKLFYEGRPRAGAQVEVFDRAPDDSVTITLHRTSSDGTAAIPVTPGHSYLFDAVVLRPAPDAGEGPDAPVWETYWAALTFKVPQ